MQDNDFGKPCSKKSGLIVPMLPGPETAMIRHPKPLKKGDLTCKILLARMFFHKPASNLPVLIVNLKFKQ